MQLNLEKYLNTVIGIFPIDIYSTEKIKVNGLKQGTNIFRINPGKSPLITEDSFIGEPYVIETFSGMLIACHPHIVGEEMEKLCLDCAKEYVKALEILGLLRDECLAILHVLRGAPSYMLAESFKQDVPIINIRPKYIMGGYRSHSNDIRNIEITYRDYPSIDNLKEISTLLIPDTYATGRSAEVALEDLIERGLKPRKIILYGFISIPALIRIGRLTFEEGIELVSFSIGNIMQLAYNKYDMPLYGLDESLYSATGELKRLGSIVDKETLKRYLPRYIAGMDQPGDWSERQINLFDGYGYERGDINGHLKKSVELINSLKNINSEQSWYNDFHKYIASTELKKVKSRQQQCQDKSFALTGQEKEAF